MVNRPAGGARSVKYEREPFDWYCENNIPVDQLFDAMGWPIEDMIWDPSCGRGNILDVAKRRGHPTFGSDVIDRNPRHPFKRVNFLLMNNPPAPPSGGQLRIVCNSPYSYVDGIAESFIRKSLDFPLASAAFLLPIAFLCSDTRWPFFSREMMPAQVAILSERPSMPPGSTLTDFTEFKGGMQDYIWIIYQPPHRWKTQTIWLRPSSRPTESTIPKRVKRIT